MLSIRMSRVGRRKSPTYRLIVSDKRKDPWGKYLELLGHYNPRSKEFVYKAERITHWISVGAQASGTVHNLLLKHGLAKGKTVKPVTINAKRKAKMDEKKAKAASAA
jgi:small subunit ribosomal protein S16